MSKFTFGEKIEEYSAKDGTVLPVWKTPKYETAKKAVIKMLESEEYKDVLDESDFWILMNRTKTGKMAYTGLIISHNGCLKINDTLPEELKFNPEYMLIQEPEDCHRTYKDSLIFTYDSSRGEKEDKQKIFEVGEVNDKNCSNDYPYAMALKRCMDRVILKNSKLAYSGVYSDSEAEEFKEQPDDVEIKEPTQEDANNWKFTFGKHNGKTMNAVLEEDNQYVQWYLNNKASEYDKKCYQLLTGEVLPTATEQDERIQLISEINNLELETNTNHEEMLNHFQANSVSEMTIFQLVECKSILEKKKKN